MQGPAGATRGYELGDCGMKLLTIGGIEVEAVLRSRCRLGSGATRL